MADITGFCSTDAMFAKLELRNVMPVQSKTFAVSQRKRLRPKNPKSFTVY